MPNDNHGCLNSSPGWGIICQLRRIEFQQAFEADQIDTSGDVLDEKSDGGPISLSLLYHIGVVVIFEVISSQQSAIIR